MKVVGHGVDIVEMSRVAGFLADTARHWAASIFSDEERRQADLPPHDVGYYAGRFAGKEAVSKALRTGFSGHVTVHTIEILRLPGGVPEVRLSGAALEIARSLGITGWSVSISRAGGLACASVIAFSE